MSYDPENTPTRPSIDFAKAKELLDPGLDLSEEERIRELLTMAWNTGRHVDRTIPPELLGSITDNPADWYRENRDRIKQMLAERTRISEIYSATEIYESSLFLATASDINDIAWNHRAGNLGIEVELAARLIVHDAVSQAQSLGSGIVSLAQQEDDGFGKMSA